MPEQKALHVNFSQRREGGTPLPPSIQKNRLAATEGKGSRHGNCVLGPVSRKREASVQTGHQGRDDGA